MRADLPRDRLLAFLDAFERGEFLAADERYLSAGDWLPVVVEFHREILDSELFLTPSEFTWFAWRDRARWYMDHPEAIREADLDTIRKLLSFSWHMQRLVGGLFPRLCSNGVMQAILERLKALSDEATPQETT